MGQFISPNRKRTRRTPSTDVPNNNVQTAGLIPTRPLPGWSTQFKEARKRAFFFLDRSLPRHSLIDRYVLMARFFRAHNRLPLDVSNPRATFNDLIFHRLTTDSWRVLERFCVDKEFAKLFVSATCPQVRIAGTVEVIGLSSDRDRNHAYTKLKALSGTSAVAKPTHGSGKILFLKHRQSEKDLYNFCQEAGGSYYKISRESQYKNLDPKIIIEDDISVASKPPNDFKFFCASGNILFCQIDVDRFRDHRRLLVTAEFDPIDVTYMYRKPEVPVVKPPDFAEMLSIAKTLSKYFYFVRVDLYSVEGETYFGELTFAPEGGAGALSDESFGVSVLHRIASSNLGQS